jgi:saccharopine dehydrogenase-like NADP-dependent oxidoreductase
MRQLLVLGAGKSAGYLVSQLLEHGEAENWFVTVGDIDPGRARQLVGDHASGEAVRFDVSDAELRSAKIEHSDVVINMLPSAYQDVVAWDCVNHARHMISVSYRDQGMRDLDTDAQRKGILLLWEMGLDPGIDHMSAMALIRKLRGDGGRIVGFRSYGSGIPAPDEAQNPLRYVITWDPRNVVMAGAGGAQYMEDGQIKIVPYQQVFQHTWAVDVDGIGTLEAYPNRDSLSYMQSFGLDHLKTMIRGTMRYPGWSETWNEIVRLGLPNETLRISDLAERTYAEVVEMFLPPKASKAPIEQRLARYLRINPTGRIMEDLRWLGLLSHERICCRGDTAAQMLAHLLAQRLPLAPGQRDMVVLLHELDVEYPDRDRPAEQVRSTLVLKGDPDGFSAMSRAVGLPVAIAVKLLLRGDLPLTGSRIPTHPSVYTPILREIEVAGLRFVEKSDPAAKP